jgi:hypothetical protein
MLWERSVRQMKGADWRLPDLSVLKPIQLLSRAVVIAEKLDAEPALTDPTDLGQKYGDRSGGFLKDFKGHIGPLLKRGVTFDGAPRGGQVDKLTTAGRPITQEVDGQSKRSSWGGAEIHVSL